MEFGISCEAVMINSLVEPGSLTNIYKGFRNLKKEGCNAWEYEESAKFHCQKETENLIAITNMGFCNVEKEDIP